MFDICIDCGEEIKTSLCRPASLLRGGWRYCMTLNKNTKEF